MSLAAGVIVPRNDKDFVVKESLSPKAESLETIRAKLALPVELYILQTLGPAKVDSYKNFVSTGSLTYDTKFL